MSSMSSERKKKASRENGKKSHGPKTESGKQRSAINAVKHGMLASLSTLKIEDPDGFQDTMGDFNRRFQPRDNVELSYVEELVHCYWNLRRGWLAETAALDNQMASLPPAWPEKQTLGVAFNNLECMDLYRRYETRLHLMEKRALDNLIRLRKEFPVDQPQPAQSLPAQKPAEPNEPNPKNGHYQRARESTTPPQPPSAHPSPPTTAATL